MKDLNIKNKLINYYNLYTKLKWWRKLLILGYLILAVFAVVFFSIQMKYNLGEIRPKTNNYPKVKVSNKNYLGNTTNEVISSDRSNKLIYNAQTQNIEIENNNNLYSVVPLNQYGLDNNLNQAEINNHFKYPNEQEERLFSPFLAYLTYSSTPEEAREITYKSVKVLSVKKTTNYNGVLVNYQIQSDPYDNSLYPKAINTKKLRELIRKIKLFFNNDETQFNKYLESLALSYIKSGDASNTTSLYNLIFSPTDLEIHKENIKFIWYQIYKLTDDELKKFNPNARINKYSFDIPIMYYLEGNSFKTTIISEDIKENSIIVNNSRWLLKSIKLNPNFLLAKKEDIYEAIIPDGNGALINNMETRWNGAVYGATRFIQEMNYEQKPADIKMPFLSIIKKEQKIANYFYIEDGASLANLYLEPIKNYSRIYAEFYLRRTGNATFIGESSTQAISPGYFDSRFTLAYHFINNNDLTYFNIAKDLASKYINKEQIQFRNDIALELLGAISMPSHFAGINYQKNISLTTFKEADEIINALKEYSQTYFYNNWQRDFLYQNIPAMKTKALKKLGSISELSKYDNLYLMQSFLKTYNNNYQNFANKMNGIRTLSNELKKLYDYSPITNSETKDSRNRYYLLSNRYLIDCVNSYHKTQYSSLAIDDLSLPNYEYSFRNYSPKVNDQIKNNAIDILKKKKIALNYANFNLINNANVIYDIELPISNKNNIKSPIPFYQLVLNNYYQLYLESKNIFSDAIYADNSYYQEYQLMSNVNPKYTLAYKNTNLTKDSYYYNKYYSCNYQDYLDSIKKHYQYANNFYNEYGSNVISHKAIDFNIFEVKYLKDEKIRTVVFNLNGSFYNEIMPYSHKEIL